MAFVNSTKLDHFSNKTQFLSPPVTPKQIVESSFHTNRQTEEDCWDSTSTEASSSPSSSSLYYSPNMSDNCIQMRKKSAGSINIMFTAIPSYRRKQRPIQSLPTSTKGTFRMPTFVDTVSNKKLRKRAKHDKTERNSLLCLATNDCKIEDPTSPLPIVGSVAPDQIEDHSDNNAEDEQEQIIKKAKRNAAFVYDNLSADWDQSAVFINSEEWIPKLDVFDRRPMVRISWKGSPLKIRNMPYFEKLHVGEVTIAATLRLTPEQYLKCKWALVLAAKDAYENNTLFRKSEAQKVCCIDVNKTSVLWNAFGKLGWLGSKWPQ